MLVLRLTRTVQLVKRMAFVPNVKVSSSQLQMEQSVWKNLIIVSVIQSTMLLIRMETTTVLSVIRDTHGSRMEMRKNVKNARMQSLDVRSVTSMELVEDVRLESSYLLIELNALMSLSIVLCMMELITLRQHLKIMSRDSTRTIHSRNGHVQPVTLDSIGMRTSGIVLLIVLIGI